MDNRSLEANASANPPAAPGAPSVGYPKAGNPQTNDPASKPGPYWFHAIGEELRAVIEAGGLVPALNTLTQVRDAIQAMINASLPADALVFKGVIDCSANPNYPAADAGHVYKVSVAGKIGGAAGPNVEVGDILTCVTDGSAAGDHATVGVNWTIIQANIDGPIGVAPVVHKNGNYAITQNENGKVLVADVALTFTLPQIATLTLPFEVTVKLGAATGTSMALACSGTDKVVAGGAELASTATNVRGCWMKLVADATGKWQALYKWRFESGEFSVPASAAISAAHGLGAIPSSRSAHLRDINGEIGYAAPDEIDVTIPWSSNQMIHGNTWANVDNVGMSVNVISFSVWNKTTGAGNSNITTANWRVVFRAEL